MSLRPLLVALAVLTLACGDTPPQAQPPAAPPGVSPGYVLFGPLLSNWSYLIDNDGRVVHAWQSEFSPGGGMELLPDGHLLRLGRDPDVLKLKMGGVAGVVEKLAWDGSVVWRWRHATDTSVLHHDLEPLPNGNVLLLAWELKSAEEVRRAGRRAELTPALGLLFEWVMEVEPQPPDGARVVWEWHVFDHLVQDADPNAPGYGDPAAQPERFDVNAGEPPRAIDPERLAQLQALGYVPAGAKPEDLDVDFFHANAVAYHEKLDQIAISVPHHHEIWVIDHATTTEEARGPRGDFLYRWGNPSAYRRGAAADRRLHAQHDVRWVPEGMPGAGNLLILNNGGEERPWSSVDEIAPPLGADGRYARVDGAAWGPSEPVRSWSAAKKEDWFAPFISGAHRTANGNTLICSGPQGRFFEVSSAGDVVWEYRSAFTGDAKNRDGTPAQPVGENERAAVFRATRIPPDHPALAGRSLAPLDPQPGNEPPRT
jgi:hypothetical protein